MDSDKINNERELTSTMGKVLSMSTKDEKSDTSDATPTSSTDASTTTTSSQIASDDPISSTSSDNEQNKVKNTMNQYSADEGSKESPVDPDADLLEMGMMSQSTNEKITENVDDLVQDLETLLGESTESFNIGPTRNDELELSEVIQNSGEPETTGIDEGNILSEVASRKEESKSQISSFDLSENKLHTQSDNEVSSNTTVSCEVALGSHEDKKGDANIGTETDEENVNENVCQKKIFGDTDVFKLTENEGNQSKQEKNENATEEFEVKIGSDINQQGEHDNTEEGKKQINSENPEGDITELCTEEVKENKTKTESDFQNEITGITAQVKDEIRESTTKVQIGVEYIIPSADELKEKTTGNELVLENEIPTSDGIMECTGEVENNLKNENALRDGVKQKTLEIEFRLENTVSNNSGTTEVKCIRADKSAVNDGLIDSTPEITLENEAIIDAEIKERIGEVTCNLESRVNSVDKIKEKASESKCSLDNETPGDAIRNITDVKDQVDAEVKEMPLVSECNLEPKFSYDQGEKKITDEEKSIKENICEDQTTENKTADEEKEMVAEDKCKALTTDNEKGEVLEDMSNIENKTTGEKEIITPKDECESQTTDEAHMANEEKEKTTEDKCDIENKTVDEEKVIAVKDNENQTISLQEEMNEEEKITVDSKCENHATNEEKTCKESDLENKTIDEEKAVAAEDKCETQTTDVEEQKTIEDKCDSEIQVVHEKKESPVEDKRDTENKIEEIADRITEDKCDMEYPTANEEQERTTENKGDIENKTACIEKGTIENNDGIENQTTDEEKEKRTIENICEQENISTDDEVKRSIQKTTCTARNISTSLTREQNIVDDECGLYRKTDTEHEGIKGLTSETINIDYRDSLKCIPNDSNLPIEASDPTELTEGETKDDEKEKAESCTNQKVPETCESLTDLQMETKDGTSELTQIEKYEEPILELIEKDSDYEDSINLKYGDTNKEEINLDNVASKIEDTIDNNKEIFQHVDNLNADSREPDDKEKLEMTVSEGISGGIVEVAKDSTIDKENMNVEQDNETRTVSEHELSKELGSHDNIEEEKEISMESELESVSENKTLVTDCFKLTCSKIDESSPKVFLHKVEEKVENIKDVQAGDLTENTAVNTSQEIVNTKLILEKQFGEEHVQLESSESSTRSQSVIHMECVEGETQLSTNESVVIEHIKEIDSLPQDAVIHMECVKHETLPNTSGSVEVESVKIQRMKDVDSLPQGEDKTYCDEIHNIEEKLTRGGHGEQFSKTQDSVICIGEVEMEYQKGLKVNQDLEINFGSELNSDDNTMRENMMSSIKEICDEKLQNEKDDTPHRFKEKKDIDSSEGKDLHEITDKLHNSQTNISQEKLILCPNQMETKIISNKILQSSYSLDKESGIQSSFDSNEKQEALENSELTVLNTKSDVNEEENVQDLAVTMEEGSTHSELTQDDSQRNEKAEALKELVQLSTDECSKKLVPQKVPELIQTESQETSEDKVVQIATTSVMSADTVLESNALLSAETLEMTNIISGADTALPDLTQQTADVTFEEHIVLKEDVLVSSIASTVAQSVSDIPDSTETIETTEVEKADVLIDEDEGAQTVCQSGSSPTTNNLELETICEVTEIIHSVPVANEESLPGIEDILADSGQCQESVEVQIDTEENLETILAVASLQQDAISEVCEQQLSEKEIREMEALRMAVESITDSAAEEYQESVENVVDDLVHNVEDNNFENNSAQFVSERIGEESVVATADAEPKTDKNKKMVTSEETEVNIVESSKSQDREEVEQEKKEIQMKKNERDASPDTSQCIETESDDEVNKTQHSDSSSEVCQEESKFENPFNTNSEDLEKDNEKEKSFATKITIKPIKEPNEEVSTTSDVEVNKGTLKMTITKQSDKMHSILKVYNSDEEDQDEQKEKTGDEPIPKLIIKSKMQQLEQHSPKMCTRSSKQVYSPTSTSQRCGSPRITIKPVIKPEMKGESVGSLKITIKPKTEEQSKRHNPKITVKSINKSEEEQKTHNTRLNIKPIVKPPDDSEQVHSPRITIKPIPKPNDSEHESAPSTMPKVTIKPIKRQSETEEDCEQEKSSPKITIKPLVKPSELDTEVHPTTPRVTIKPIKKQDENDKTESEHGDKSNNSQNSDSEEEVKERIVLKINKGNLPTPSKESKKREHPPDEDKSEKLAKIKLKFSKEGGHPHIVQQSQESNKRLRRDSSNVSQTEESNNKRSRKDSNQGLAQATEESHKRSSEDRTLPEKNKKLKTDSDTPLHESTRSRHRDVITNQGSMETNDDSNDEVKLIEPKMNSPIVISEDSRSQNSADCIVVEDSRETLSASSVEKPSEPAVLTPTKEVTSSTVSPAAAATLPVTTNPPAPAPRKRGRPRKVPLVVREEFKDPMSETAKEEHQTEVTRPVSDRPKRSCRGQNVMATLGIKPRKPRGRGRGRGGKVNMGTRPIPMKPAKEPKLSKARLKLMQKSAEEELKNQNSSTVYEKDNTVISGLDVDNEARWEEIEEKKDRADKRKEKIGKKSDVDENSTKRDCTGKETEESLLSILPDAACKSLSQVLGPPMCEPLRTITPISTSSEITDIVMVDEETRMSSDTSSRAQTPAKQVVAPTDIIEESQSSVQSTGTTESGKASSSRPSKAPRLEVHQEPEGAIIAADQLAEYYWNGNGPFMLQEQVAQFLGIKSFKRKYPGITRRMVDMQERDFIRESGLASEAMCDLGLTSVNSADILDIMYSDFQEKYEEYCKHQRDRQAKELINKQKALTLAASQEKNKIDITEQAVQSAAQWNANFNKTRREQRKAAMDLQSLTVHYPKGKMKLISKPNVGHYPVALVPGQFTDFYQEYTPTEINNLPLNTMCYDSINIPEDSEDSDDGSDSDSDSSSSSSGSSGSSSSVEDCKLCKPSKKVAAK